jgi:hypothetical protein
MKTDEEILREEIRALREIILKLYQWGVAFIATLQTAIFFIRREVLNGLIDSGRLPKGSLLPAWRYFSALVLYFSLHCSLRRCLDLPASGTSGTKPSFWRKSPLA